MSNSERTDLIVPLQNEERLLSKENAHVPSMQPSKKKMQSLITSMFHDQRKGSFQSTLTDDSAFLYVLYRSYFWRGGRFP